MNRFASRWVVRTFLFVAVGGGAGLHVGGCLGPSQCENLRAELRTERDSWASCDPSKGDDQCRIVGGDPQDCTGVFTCDFAVQVSNLRAAQDAVVDNTIHRAQCEDFCATPTCATDTAPICDPTLHQCIIVFLEAGTMPTPPQQDSGNPNPPPDAQAE